MNHNNIKCIGTCNGQKIGQILSQKCSATGCSTEKQINSFENRKFIDGMMSLKVPFFCNKIQGFGKKIGKIFQRLGMFRTFRKMLVC